MMRLGIGRLLLVLVSVILVDCASRPEGSFALGETDALKSIYLVSHGWHVGIVMRRADVPEGVWPQHNDFPDAEYLEVGWGDKDYYMSPNPHLAMALKAGLLPTPSVLHIVGFSGSVVASFPQNEIIRVDLSHDGFKRLCSYIENSYAKDEAGSSQMVGKGLYGSSRFFMSRETYHAFNSCNVWAARALHNAGCPIAPATTLTAADLMTRAASFGAVIQAEQGFPRKRHPADSEGCR